ncbi:MAG: hypothetical protein A2X86_05135 [Bdellovibrionales bacterium GWA2_49_15]|nr:MAG: hypothetical protein A2X86_05135 [Bdellovibrionales bacterium GWA2_49_15]
MIRLTLIVLCLLISGNVIANDKDKLVIAEVNGHPILLKDFETTYQQNLLFIADKIVTKEKVINDLINRELGIDRAKKSKLQDDALVKQKMEDVLYHAQVSKDLEPLLKKIVVTDEDVKDYYVKHPEYRTAHILFRMTANPSDNEIKGALEVAGKVYEQLKTEPHKFSELANKFSQTSAAPNGGDIGFQPAVRLAPEYFIAINGKPQDYITTPVRSQFGYHIIKVLSVRDFKEINIPLYKKIVYDVKRDEILNDYFATLRKGANIKIDKKYL